MSNIHVSARATEPVPAASFQERSVWIQLVSMLLVQGGYFFVAWRMLSKGVTFLPEYVPVFAASVILVVVVSVAAHVAAAILSRPDQADERDRMIGWRAAAGSGWLVAAGVLAGITAMIFSVPNVWVAHLLFTSLFLSEVLKLALQLVYYRRGL
jgi:hypothetical protein